MPPAHHPYEIAHMGLGTAAKVPSKESKASTASKEPSKLEPADTELAALSAELLARRQENDAFAAQANAEFGAHPFAMLPSQARVAEEARLLTEAAHLRQL